MFCQSTNVPDEGVLRCIRAPMQRDRPATRRLRVNSMLDLVKTATFMGTDRPTFLLGAERVVAIDTVPERLNC